MRRTKTYLMKLARKAKAEGRPLDDVLAEDDAATKDLQDALGKASDGKVGFVKHIIDPTDTNAVTDLADVLHIDEGQARRILDDLIAQSESLDDDEDDVIDLTGTEED